MRLTGLVRPISMYSICLRSSKTCVVFTHFDDKVSIYLVELVFLTNSLAISTILPSNKIQSTLSSNIHSNCLAQVSLQIFILIV